MCWFYISEKRLAKRYFKFLKERGFRSRTYNGIGHDCADFEIVYTKRKCDFVVEVGGQYSIKSTWIPNAKIGTDEYIDEMFKNSVYEIYVIIQHNHKRAHMVCCDLFDKESREKLKTDIDNTDDKNTEQKIKIYSEFLKNELDKLNI